MGYDSVGCSGIYYGYFLDLELVLDLEKFVENLLKTEDSVVDCEYNSERGLDCDHISEIESFMETSFEEFVKKNPGLFKPKFDCSKLNFFVFYEEILACYETQPVGGSKILWGYNLNYNYVSNPNIIASDESKFENRDVKMRFPNNAGKIFINFLESIKTTKISSAELERDLEFGPRARIH